MSCSVRFASPWRIASSTLAKWWFGVLLSYGRVLVVSVLGPCRLLAGAALHGPERGGCLDDESALSGDGSVCSGPRCTVVSPGGAAPILSSCLGSSVLGVAYPALHVWRRVSGTCAICLLPFLSFVSTCLYEGFLTTTHRSAVCAFVYKGGRKTVSRKAKFRHTTQLISSKLHLNKNSQWMNPVFVL